MLATPSAPTLCVIQPSLCGPTTGTVTITSPTPATGVEYTIDNGNSWQTGNVFNNLIPGSCTGIKVKNAAGCISEAAICSQSNCATRFSNEGSSDNVTKSQTETLSQIVKQQQTSFKPTFNTGNDKITEKATTVKAYPNPFSDKVIFEVSSAQSGNGSLEIVNMLGQKVKTVYQGFSAGSQTFELSLPVNQISHLVYVLRIGNKKMTGKLLQINQ
jgi:hypothetical protein